MKLFIPILAVISTLLMLIVAILSSAVLSILLKEETNQINFAKWAQLGDFLGGTLNPTFAFFALLALLYTIKQQSEALKLSKDELSATREELEKSRIAQEEQSKSLELQNQATKLQMFENTFFKLQELFFNSKSAMYIQIVRNNDMLIKIDNQYYKLNHDIKLDGGHSLTEVLYLLPRILNQCFNNDYNRFDGHFYKYTSSYFGQLYQIFKFINFSNIKNKNIYINILRAQLNKHEIELLFHHCLGNIGKRKFKKFVENNEFFEYINLNQGIEQKILEYDINAFGKNQKIIDKYNELKGKSTSVKAENL